MSKGKDLWFKTDARRKAEDLVSFLNTKRLEDEIADALVTSYDEGYDKGYDEGYAKGEQDSTAYQEGYEKGKRDAEEAFRKQQEKVTFT
jgi:hypothetical protein